MRAKSGAARNWRKKRIFKRAKGFVGGRRRLLKSAKETLLRAGMFAFRDRRAKKRDLGSLFITRLSAAAEMRGLRHSRLEAGVSLQPRTPRPPTGEHRAGPQAPLRPGDLRRRGLPRRSRPPQAR